MTSPGALGGLTAIAVALAALAIAGCGEDSEVSAVAGQPGVPGQPDPDALEAFQDCMSDQGVDSPTLSFGPGGPPSGRGQDAPKAPSGKEMRAMEACRDKLPAPPGGEGGFQVMPAPPGG